MRKTSRTTTTLALTVALTLGACSDTPATTSTSENRPTTAAPATTTAAPAVVGYEYTVPLGEGGITYRDGGADLEMVGPNVVTAGHGAVYFADPVANELWIMTADSTEQIDLAASDIRNVTAMALGEDRLYLVEVFSGSAPVPLDEQLINGAPGITVTEDGRVITMIATVDGLQITELTPFPNRITASSI